MTGCPHGLDDAWCYLCRIDHYGVDTQILWGIALDDELRDLAGEPGPMTPEVSDYLRFFCDELGLAYDPTFTLHEATVVIESFLGDAATASQRQTLAALVGGGSVGADLSYAEARTKIRRAVALRGLRSA